MLNVVKIWQNMILESIQQRMKIGMNRKRIHRKKMIVDNGRLELSFFCPVSQCR